MSTHVYYNISPSPPQKPHPDPIPQQPSSGADETVLLPEKSGPFAFLLPNVDDDGTERSASVHLEFHVCSEVIGRGPFLLSCLSGRGRRGLAVRWASIVTRPRLVGRTDDFKWKSNNAPTSPRTNNNNNRRSSRMWSCCWPPMTTTMMSVHTYVLTSALAHFLLSCDV